MFHFICGCVKHPVVVNSEQLADVGDSLQQISLYERISRLPPEQSTVEFSRL